MFKTLSTDAIYQILESFYSFVVIDEKGVIVYINKNYTSYLGVDQKQAIGQHISKVIPGTKLNLTLKTGIEEFGALFTLYDHTKQEEVTLICNRIPIKENGRITGALAMTTIRNLNEFDALQQEIGQLKLDNQEYKKKLAILQKSLHPLDKIIGNAKPFREVKRCLEEFSKSNLPILITGETGVGKELFANAVHQLSNRRLSNYVKINCAAIPKDLLESELFGYVEGAFSGAVKGGKMGKFELANNGTVLLDEIGEMPLELQSKLLRVLQEKEFEKVGSVETVSANVRIICSTNRNMEELVQSRQFREDLYYRINTIELRIPSLREHLADLPLLCDHFIKNTNSENNYNITGIDDEVLHLFNTYNWPGNVRELEHVIERAALSCRSGQIQRHHCDFLLTKIKNCPGADLSPKSLKDKTNNFERDSILKALHETGGNKSKAAKLLDIDRTILYDKLKKYKITL
ncbi:PAS domain-containing protein [Aminipila butyrica]|uniref:PAS domain-containing protein n=1 Tax=Aminipila butyrica TaxID=433296 RepID=A0A858BVM7_9FIRM|nr:sigma 54-interacting transcriptional regulator [Aminipila butyrica]QIB68960.1 PAS domain-containing protein [Aminipila butyrica]